LTLALDGILVNVLNVALVMELLASVLLLKPMKIFRYGHLFRF